MNIIEAAQALTEGKIVRRAVWDKGADWYFGNMKWANSLEAARQGCPDQSYPDAMPSIGDILATDWEVVE